MLRWREPGRGGLLGTPVQEAAQAGAEAQQALVLALIEWAHTGTVSSRDGSRLVRSAACAWRGNTARATAPDRWQFLSCHDILVLSVARQDWARRRSPPRPGEGGGVAASERTLRHYRMFCRRCGGTWDAAYDVVTFHDVEGDQDLFYRHGLPAMAPWSGVSCRPVVISGSRSFHSALRRPTPTP